MLATALFGLLFYVYYWQWRGLFNEEGRYFYEPEALVFHDESIFLIVPSVVFARLAGVCLFYARLDRRGRAVDLIPRRCLLLALGRLRRRR